MIFSPGVRSYSGPEEKTMRSRIAFFASLLVLVSVLTALPAMAQTDDTPPPTGKLMVVWTSADPDVADKVCLMYTHASKAYGWFADVTLVVWGPSQRLLIGDPQIQAKVKSMQEAGIKVEACMACAKKLGLVEQLKALGIDVKGMGVPLTEALKDPGTEVLTF